MDCLKNKKSLWAIWLDAPPTGSKYGRIWSRDTGETLPGSSQTIKRVFINTAKKSIIIEEISGDDKDREPDYRILREPGSILTCEVKLPGINL